jgi:hypothetical protein
VLRKTVTPSRDQAGQVIAQGRRRQRIKPGSWLIQEDEWRVVKERAGDREFLFHAPAPGAHLILATFPEIQVGEQFFDASPAIRRRHPVDAPVQVEIVLGAHALVESGKFKQHPTAGANGIGLGAGIKAQDPGLTGRWFQQAKQQVDGRGFARPIWSQKPEDDASRHLQ